MVPTATEAACDFRGSTDEYLQDSVAGTNTLGVDPAYYNTRYYATPTAAASLAGCLGGTVVPISSGFAAGSPFQQPNMLGVQLSNGQVINAGDAISVYVGWNADQGGAIYSAWEKYVNMPSGGYVSTGVSGVTSGTSGTTGITGNTSYSGSYANNLIKILTDMIQTYKAIIAASPTTNTSSYTTASGPVFGTTGATTGTVVTTQSVSGPVSARFIKIQSSSRSWVAWREIEVYDKSGNKLTPAAVTASCTWCKYTGDPSLVSPEKSIDGNTSTVWNAGETNPTCDWGSLARLGCGTGGQSAWIQIDLGRVADISKIRLLTENNPNPAEATHSVLAGTANTNLTKIAEFNGNINTNTWLEVIVTNSGAATTGTAGIVGAKSSNFSYTFTKVGSSWMVTLDNMALGTPADRYYIPANYSITAATAAELNLTAQGRFNSGYYFPGTPAGNTFYSEMFSAFIRAYYDWNNKTK